MSSGACEILQQHCLSESIRFFKIHFRKKDFKDYIPDIGDESLVSLDVKKASYLPNACMLPYCPGLGGTLMSRQESCAEMPQLAALLAHSQPAIGSAAASFSCYASMHVTAGSALRSQ